MPSLPPFKRSRTKGLTIPLRGIYSRSEELQADLHRRLNRVIGQLGGVKTMIDDNRYCADVLTQLAAAESAVHSISAVVLRNHLETCVVEQIERGNVEIIDEVMNLLKKFSR